MAIMFPKKNPVGLDLRYICVRTERRKKEKARGVDGWVYEDGTCRFGLLEMPPTV
jgi:hypothetical protein